MENHLDPAEMKVLGDEILVVSNTAVGLASVPSGADYAEIYPSDADPFRCRWDATDPDASNGVLLDEATTGHIEMVALFGGTAIAKFKAIRSGLNDSQLYAVYYQTMSY